MRDPACLPQRVLQSPRQRLEALSALDHFSVLPARESQHEVIQQMGKRNTGDRDLQLTRGSEIRQTELAWRVLLRKEDFFLRPGDSTPLPDAPLQRAQ